MGYIRLIGRGAAALAAFVTFGAMAAESHSGPHDHGPAMRGTMDGAAGIGKPGKARKVARTIVVDMSDTMRFDPEQIHVAPGETVRFVVRNRGQVAHELNLGTEAGLMTHLEAMRRDPQMMHDEPGKVTVAPGQQREFVWKFPRAGLVVFACLIPGHYEAGMKGTITVGA